MDFRINMTFKNSDEVLTFFQAMTDAGLFDSLNGAAPQLKPSQMSEPPSETAPAPASVPPRAPQQAQQSGNGDRVESPVKAYTNPGDKVSQAQLDFIFGLAHQAGWHINEFQEWLEGEQGYNMPLQDLSKKDASALIDAQKKGELPPPETPF